MALNSIKTAYVLGGIAALVSAVTTFFLWWLPQTYGAPESFEQAVTLHANDAYMARLWINYIHVFIALFAYAVVAAALRRCSPIAAATGFIAFLFWAVSEALGVSINIWAVNETWRAGYLEANGDTKQVIQNSIHTFQGFWNGIFFVVLTTFLIGTSSYGIAFWGKGKFENFLSVMFWLAAPLTLIIMLDSYFGASLSKWIEWSYPTLQPLSRAATGIWLLNLAFARQ